MAEKLCETNFQAMNWHKLFGVFLLVGGLTSIISFIEDGPNYFGIIMKIILLCIGIAALIGGLLILIANRFARVFVTIYVLFIALIIIIILIVGIVIIIQPVNNDFEWYKLFTILTLFTIIWLLIFYCIGIFSAMKSNSMLKYLNIQGLKPKTKIAKLIPFMLVVPSGVFLILFIITIINAVSKGKLFHETITTIILLIGVTIGIILIFIGSLKMLIKKTGSSITLDGINLFTVSLILIVIHFIINERLILSELYTKQFVGILAMIMYFINFIIDLILINYILKSKGYQQRLANS
ncbi:MAG: hypothetical protein OEV44_03620 [Spirochaetota bacterium]|nr:hypothetical protein [Spirochaetota bacterium]